MIKIDIPYIQKEESKMKIAIVGSRMLQITSLRDYLPQDADEIISGGAKGIDRCAAEYAKQNGICLTEILPDYNRYGRAAPIRRNERIVEAADSVIAFWDGKSKGTKYVIEYCKKNGVPIRVVLLER